MAKRETRRATGSARKSSFKKTLIIICVVLGILLIAGIALYVSFITTDGFGGRINTLRVQIGKDSYSDSADGLILNSGTEIKVKSLTGSLYEVRIEISDKADFEFSVAGESGYHWRYLAGKDVTEYFVIEDTEEGFQIFHNGIYELLSKIQGADAVCNGEVKVGDFFTMIITCGERERRFGFYPDPKERPTGISLDMSVLVFGGGATVQESTKGAGRQ